MGRTATAPAKASGRHTLSYQLREIIDSRGLTAYAAAKLAGVDPGIVSRWLSGQRDIRMETADKLAEAMGLRLVETAVSRPRPPRGRPSKPPRPSPLRPDPADDGGDLGPPESDPGPC